MQLLLKLMLLLLFAECVLNACAVLPLSGLVLTLQAYSNICAVLFEVILHVYRSLDLSIF